MNADLWHRFQPNLELRLWSDETRKQQRGRHDCIFIYSFYLFVISAQTSTILHTTDVIKGQWINFRDNRSKDRKDTEKKRLWFFTTKQDIIVKNFPHYLLYTLSSADDAMATVCVLERKVPSRSSKVSAFQFSVSFFLKEKKTFQWNNSCDAGMQDILRFQ